MDGGKTHPRLSATRRRQRRMGRGHSVGQSRLPTAPGIRSAQFALILTGRAARRNLAKAVSRLFAGHDPGPSDWTPRLGHWIDRDLAIHSAKPMALLGLDLAPKLSPG